MTDIHAIYEKICKGDLIVAHEGVISSDLISDILANLEDKLIADGVSLKVVKKIYNIMVEALQNLYHHLEIPPNVFFKNSKFENGCKYAIVAMVREGKGYRITTGNFIKKENCHFLRDRIEQLNYLSHEELKELYKLVLNNDEFSAKGGGGLGFIEMARKSGNKFGYEFLPFDENYEFFVLEIVAS